MMEKQTRKLAAIMFTDIAGYTESMSFDEETAIQAVKKKRSIIQPLLIENNGVFVKEIGDGTLSYFNSAIDASTCAVKLQEKTFNDAHLNIRVGLHIGDIVFDGKDVFGEGVNIASRLESISPIGGICVSKSVFDELENKKEFTGTSLGLQSLKGVGRLVEVYALQGEKLKEPDPSKFKETEVEKHTDDEVPSIAIIPFDNKGAPEDIFYAYGISSDLISYVTSAGLIRVASLKDIEKLDYQNLDSTEISKKLFIRYIAQGTLWKMGDMFQMSIELYDTKESRVVWSDRWQEQWENLPKIKTHLSDGLLKALDTKPKIEKKEDTTNPQAYEFYLKAKHKYEKRDTMEDTEIARGLINKALELDDNLISAKILMGNTIREMGNHDKAMDIFTASLKQAEELGDKHGMGDSFNSIGAIYFHKGDFDKALECSNKSIAIADDLNDKYRMAISLNNNGVVSHNKGDYEEGLDYYQRSLEIQEEIGDKYGLAICLCNIGIVNNLKGDYEKSKEYLENSLKAQNELGVKWLELETYSYLYHSYKKLGKSFDLNQIQKLIKKTNNIEFYINYQLYKLLGDVTYLDIVHDQLQTKADAMDKRMKKIYLEYPLQKEIMEAWKKLNA